MVRTLRGGVYISFSGGKDSTVLLDLVRRCHPDVPAVFIDTGLEYPEIRSFALSKDNVVRLEPQLYNRHTREYERITFK
jgi:3'-phosphoadenosine 5'-phosphosulfate sulfotransferase (PAPS reductase)/FAD synthetase